MPNTQSFGAVADNRRADIAKFVFTKPKNYCIISSLIKRLNMKKPIEPTYQWMRGDTTARGAAETDYTMAMPDAGEKIMVEVGLDGKTRNIVSLQRGTTALKKVQKSKKTNSGRSR